MCLPKYYYIRGDSLRSPAVVIVILEPEIIKKAESFKGLDYASTRPLTKKRDTIGFLGQYAVVKKLKEVGHDVVSFPYFTEDKKGDECDFIFKGRKWDVKSSPLGIMHPDCPKCKLLIKEDSKDKKMHRYVFVKIDLKYNLAHIVGCITYKRFWKIARPFKGKNVKYPCRYVLTKELDKFGEYVWPKERKDQN